MHPCIHVHYAHLDLVDIGQNMSATDRLMGTLNPMKKFSNRSTLRPQNPKIHRNVPCFCPSKNFFILTLHTHRQSLDCPLISMLTSQPIHEHAAAHERQVICSQFTRTPLIAKLLKRCLLVATGVPYKSQLTLDPCHRPFMP